MEQRRPQALSVERKLSVEVDDQIRRALGAVAASDCCPACGHQLDLPPPARRSEMPQEQLDKMIAEIHEEELAVLLDGVYDPAMRAKIESSYWKLRQLQPRFS